MSDSIAFSSLHLHLYITMRRARGAKDQGTCASRVLRSRQHYSKTEEAQVQGGTEKQYIVLFSSKYSLYLL